MNEEKGWILVYRSLQDHWLWDDKPFSKGQAWIDILLLANHDDHRFMYKDEVVVAERGQLNRSMSSLAERWGWSKSKTVRFLKDLQADDMVTVETDHNRTTITVENYASLQDLWKTSGTRMAHERSTSDKRVTNERKHTNNEKNSKNEKNKRNKADYSSVYEDAPPELHEAMKAFEEMRLSMKGVPFTENAFRLIMEKVHRLSGGDIQESIDILSQSVERGWRGVFEIKEDKKSQPEISVWDC